MARSIEKLIPQATAEKKQDTEHSDKKEHMREQKEKDLSLESVGEKLKKIPETLASLKATIGSLSEKIVQKLDTNHERTPQQERCIKGLMDMIKNPQTALLILASSRFMMKAQEIGFDMATNPNALMLNIETLLRPEDVANFMSEIISSSDTIYSTLGSSISNLLAKLSRISSEVA